MAVLTDDDFAANEVTPPAPLSDAEFHPDAVSKPLADADFHPSAVQAPAALSDAEFQPAQVQPPVPDSTLAGSFAASASAATLHTGAAAADLVGRAQDELTLPMQGGKARNPANQTKLEQLGSELEALNKTEPPASSGYFDRVAGEFYRARETRAKTLAREIQRLQMAPANESTAAFLRDAADLSWQQYGANPESKNTMAQIGRGAGGVFAAIPAMMVSGPGAMAQMAGTTYESAYSTEEKVARSNGLTDPDEIDALAKGFAVKETAKVAPQIALYAVGGKIAAGIAGKLIGSAAAPLTKALAGFAGATVANVGVGSVIRALEAEDGKGWDAAVPRVENLTADTLFAAFHGYGEYKEATAKAKAKAKAELLRRGFEAKQLDEQTPPPPDAPAPADAVTPPKDEIGGDKIKAKADEVEAAGLPATADALREKADEPTPPPPAPSPADLPDPEPSGEAPTPPRPETPEIHRPEVELLDALRNPLPTDEPSQPQQNQAGAEPSTPSESATEQPLPGMDETPGPAPASEVSPVTYVQPDRAARRGDVSVAVNVDAFDSAWKKDPGFYVGEGGTGEIAGRRQGFADWRKANPGKPIETPEVSLDANGNPVFTNGRHRFASLRDEGAKTIEVSMSPEDAARARANGMAADAPREAPAAAPKESPTETETAGLHTQEVPLDKLALSTDVPQFKGGADEHGIVEPLAGKYDRRGVGPIQVWRRLNGALEVISGRHRFDLAKRSGETTIPAQIHNEADGFDARAAASLDAELNIRDGQGSTADYASYFRHAEISEADASARGLLARAKGRAGFSIATRASEDVFALHQSGRLTDAAAEAVADAAPNNPEGQRLGVRAIFGGAGINDAANAIRAALAGAGEAKATQGDFFSDTGLDEQWLAQGRVASQRQKALREEIGAVQGAAKKPELARKHGVDVQDPAGVQKRIAELRADLDRWQDWYKHPDLVKITKGEPAEGSKGTQLKPGQQQGDLLAGTKEDVFNLAGEKGTDHVAAAERAAQAERDAAEAKRIQDEQQGSLFGAKKAKRDTGTPDLFEESAGKPKAEGTPIQDAYERLREADPWKFPAVAISDLARESGVPLETLKARLLELHKQGKIVLSVGDWSLSSESKRAGVIEIGGQRMLQVRPIEGEVLGSKTPKPAENTFLERIHAAAEKAPSQADLDAAGQQPGTIDLENPARPKGANKISVQNTREALAKLADRYRPKSNGGHLQAVAERIGELKDKIAGKVRVRVLRNEGDLPAEVRRRLKPGDVHEGLADTDNGDVWIFADNIASPERAAEVFAHEVIGHFGVEKIVSEAEWKGLADSIIKRAPKAVADIVRRYAGGKAIDQLTPAERATVAREYVAQMAEKPSINPPLWKKAVQLVKDGLRALGIRKEWSDDDIRDLIRKAGRAVENGESSPQTAGRLSAAVKDLGDDVATHSPYAGHIEEALEKALPDEGSRGAVDRYVAAKMTGEAPPALVGPERAVAERFLTYFRAKAEFAKRNGVAGAVQDAYEAKMAARPDMQLAERLATYSAETNRIVAEKTTVRPETGTTKAAESSSPTSIRNAVVDGERAKRGLPPAMEPARREFGTVWDEAMREVDANPDAPRALVDSLEDKPRPMTDKENALLLHRQITLQGDFDRAARAAVEARDGGDGAGAEEHGLRAAIVADELQRLYDVGKRVGTANARGLNSRKMLANEDYSLAAMTLKKRAANGGKPLEPEQQQQLELEAKSIAEKTAEAEAATSKVETTKATAAATDALKETVAKVKPAPKPKSTKPPKVGNEAPAASERTKSWLEKQAEAARQRIKDRGPRLMAGIDPLDLADRVIVGASDIASGLRDFAGWASKQVREWGDKITPHLQEIWEKSNALVKQHENTAKYAAKMAERVQEDGAMLGDLRGYIRKIAEDLVRGGVTDLNPLLDQLHPVVADVLPGTTRRQVMDVFSGYGEFRPLDKDAVKAQVRDLRGQAQQSGKIEDMQAGMAPKKTGPERRTPSDKERALIKEVEALKKKGGYTVTNPESQLKTAMQAIKTRLRNQIVDMATRLDTGERPPAKAGVKYDDEAQSLRDLRDRVKQTLADLEGKPTMTEEQRLKSATDAVKRSIDEYNRRLEEEDFAKRGAKKQPSSPELDTLRAERDALKAEYEEFRQLHEDVIRERGERREQDLAAQIAELDRKMQEGDTAPAPRDASEPTQKAEDLKAERDAMQKQLDEMRRPVLTPAEKAARAQARALKGFKARTAARIAELTRKLAAGDFAPKPPKASLTLDEEAMRLQADLARAKTDFERGLIKDRLSKRNVYERTLDGAAKWRRAFVLSGFHTLAKLTSAAGEIIGIAPIEEAAGGVIGKLPGARAVAARAPRHGGFSARAEIEAVTSNVTKLFKDVGDYMKTGATDLDAVFGDAHLYPFEWKEMIGRIHGMLKTPARRNEWTRSFRKRMDFAARQGVDITDPVVQSKIGLDAYKDANKSIFMEDNIVVDAYKRALSRFSQPEKHTGKPSAGGKAIESLSKFMLPVVRIPTNIVARTFEYTLGTVTGSVRMANAFRRGIDTLPPEQADLIMQNLKRGSLGASVLLLGFLNPQAVGGYYSGKRDEQDVKPGELRVAGVDIPKVLIHNPLLEQLQLGATVRRVVDSKVRKGHEKDGIGAGMLAAAMGLIQETPFVNQMIRQAKAFAPHGQDAYFGELMKSLAPQILQELANHGDIDPATGKPRQRKPVTAMDHVKLAIPGARESVPEKKKK